MTAPGDTLLRSGSHEKASLIYKKTGNLRAVQLLLGLTGNIRLIRAFYR